VAGRRAHSEILSDESQGVGCRKEGRLRVYGQWAEAMTDRIKHTPTCSYLTGSNLPSVRMSDWLYGDPVALNKSCAAWKVRDV
jgi:hypothetical protein